jgi:hypothetical protein
MGAQLFHDVGPMRLDGLDSQTVAAKVLIVGETIDLQALLRFQQEQAGRHPSGLRPRGTRAGTCLHQHLTESPAFTNL